MISYLGVHIRVMSIHLIFKLLGEIAVMIITTLEFSRVKNPLVH